MKQPIKPEPNGYGQHFFNYEARTRARDLLWEHLTDEQREQYAVLGYFYARGKETGWKYVIDGGIRLVDRSGFCIHVTGIDRSDHSQLPFEDQLLALKILVELDEDLFLKIANYSDGKPLRRSDGTMRLRLG